jgi:hypothetical protein
MPKLQNNRQWYQQKRWILGSLLLFPPLGIPLLWLTRWPRAGKVGGSIISSILLLSMLSGEAKEPTVTSVEPSAMEATEAPTKTEPIESAAYGEAISEATAASKETTVAESSEDWDRVASRWQRALSSLGDIPIGSNDYQLAQAKMAEYERNYDSAIMQRDKAESAEAEVIAQQQAAEEVIAQQQAEELAQAALSVVETEGGYVSGTCKDLRARGIGGNFTPGDANYTPERDRDDDGVACES